MNQIVQWIENWEFVEPAWSLGFFGLWNLVPIAAMLLVWTYVSWELETK